MKQIISHALFFLVIAVSYYLGGRLGLALQVPPGQATAIWPASGIALAAMIVADWRFWPAVFAGAMGTSLSHHDVIDFQALSVAMPIALGAALQACFGAWIIRKFCQAPLNLETLRDVIKIMFFGGVVACCINASVGTATLLYAEFITYHDLIYHWGTWWLGDTLGVLVFTPVLLLLFLKQADKKDYVSLRRKWSVAVPVFIIFFTFVSLFWAAKEQFSERAHNDFQDQVSEIASTFEKDVAIYINSLVAVESFFNSSEYVSAEEFENFTMKFFSNTPGISGISWIQKVQDEERSEFEKSIQNQGYRDFQIKRRFDMGVLKASEKKPFYLPITYTQPYEVNRKAHGFDVYGVDPVGKNVRMEPLDEARDSAKSKATGRFSIVQQEDQYGFIIYHPVYAHPEKTFSVKERRENLIGYVNGIFVFPSLMKPIYEEAKSIGVDVILKDIDAEPREDILYDSRTENFKENSQESYNFEQLNSFSHSFEMAGRTWKIYFLNTVSVLPPEYRFQLWFMAIAGILFMALLSLFMVMLTARTDIVEKLVGEKTAALSQANEELEEMAYRASHDLRSPLVSSIALLDVVKEAIRENNQDRAQRGIGLVHGSLVKLESLVEDILSLAYAKNLEEEKQPVILGEIIDSALDKFSYMENYDRLEVKKNIELDGPILTYKSRVVLVAENLISNAIKYQDPEQENPYIKVSVFQSENDIVFSVEDNGLGVPEAQRDKLFNMFKRFHANVSFGSGLGLYMVKKSASILGGSIDFEDTGRSSVFTLKFPKS